MCASVEQTEYHRLQTHNSVAQVTHSVVVVVVCPGDLPVICCDPPLPPGCTTTLANAGSDLVPHGTLMPAS